MTIRTINVMTGEESERELTEQEIAALPGPVIPTPIQLLEELDSNNALTQRNLREIIILLSESIKHLSNGNVDIAQIPGVAKVYIAEASAVKLREQL